MEWYNILGFVVTWVADLYLQGKIYENMNGGINEMIDGGRKNRVAEASFFVL